MDDWQGKVAIITGGSSGFGFSLSCSLAQGGCRVVIAARSEENVLAAAKQIQDAGGVCLPVVADVTVQEEVDRLVTLALQEFSQIDLLIHAAGRSMRGAVSKTTIDEFQSLWEINFLAAVRCTQAALPHLEKTRGHVVLIGSLAAKVAARWLGAYPTSKFPLAAYAQQLRLELEPTGVHVLLVCPGPIAGNLAVEEAGRYAEQSAGLPEAAAKPGGGAKLRAIDPLRLAEQVLSSCRRRRPELIVPAKARLLFILSQISPRLGDWLLKKMT